MVKHFGFTSITVVDKCDPFPVGTSCLFYGQKWQIYRKESKCYLSAEELEFCSCINISQFNVKEYKIYVKCVIFWIHVND